MPRAGRLDVQVETLPVCVPSWLIGACKKLYGIEIRLNKLHFRDYGMGLGPHENVSLLLAGHPVFADQNRLTFEPLPEVSRYSAGVS